MWKRSLLILLMAFLMLQAYPCCAASAADPPKPTVLADDKEDYWIKVNTISPPPSLPSDQNMLIGSRLDNLASGKTDPKQFFRQMGKDGMKVSDLYGFKADFIRAQADDIARTTGGSALDALPQAYQAWDKKYGHAERTLMDTRRVAVQKAWDSAIKTYLQKHPDFPYIIKMDVGSWPTESWNDLRFEGDIDATVITSMVENAVELRDLYNQEIRADLEMDMAALEAHATAHRRATLDVYITEPGADWAEVDALNRGKLKEVVINGDNVSYRDVTDPIEKLYIFANLKNNVDIKKGSPDKLASLMDEGVPKPDFDMEPAVSLEFLRHLTTDAIHSNISPHERLVKLAKFVERSAADHQAMLKDFPTKPVDADLGTWAKRVIAVKQSKELTPAEKLKKILDMSKGMLGNPSDSASIEGALKALGERSAGFIRHNIDEGIDAHMKAIDQAKSPSEKDSQRKQLLDVLEQTFDAYREKGVDFPPKAHETMIALAEQLKKRALRMPISEQKRLMDILEKASENPNATRLSLALIWQKTAQYYNTANDTIDAVNYLLDGLDRPTADRLRALNTEFKFGGEGQKINITIPIPIGAINDKLNSTVLGTIGNSMPFKAFNLMQEGQAYIDAVMKGKDWNESFSNLSTEIFRNHVPGGSIVEAAVMENYTRVAIGVVYLIFPVTAVPEALYGMGMAAAGWGVSRWQQWMYDEMVDALYQGTEFEKDGEQWKVVSITYQNPGRPKPETVTASEAYKLPELCPAISNILLPQVREDPTIAMYHELLLNTAISDGQSDIPVWPRKYRNLSKYGEKLWAEYAEAVRSTTRRFFAGVIEELEKRHAFEQGEGQKKLREIEQEIGCSGPLIELTGNPSKDRKAMEDVISNYEKLKQVNAEIRKIHDRWDAFALQEHKPSCSDYSIRTNLEEATKSLAEARRAVREATVGVEEIVGRQRADHKTLKPAVAARIGAVVNPEGSSERKRYISEYREYLDSLRKQPAELEVRIMGPDTICQGKPFSFTAVLDREARNPGFDWKLEPDGSTEGLKNRKGSKVEWEPIEPGTYKLAVYAELKDLKTDWVRAVKTVKVLAPGEYPQPVVGLSAPVDRIDPGEVLPVTAITTSFGLNGENFDRYFWSVNGRQVTASAENVFYFDGRGYEGQTAEISVYARTKDNYHSESSTRIAVSPNATAGPLRVMITPETSELTAGERATFRAVVLGRSAGGDLRLQWSLDDTVIGNGDMVIIDTEPFAGKSFTLGLYALQTEADRIIFEGQVTRTIKVVRDSKVAVRLSPWPKTVTDTENLRLEVSRPDKDLGYEWFEWRGRFWSTNPVAVGPVMSASMAGLSGQSVKFMVVATDRKGRTASAEAGPIEVSDPAWPDPEDEEEKEEDAEKTEKTADKTDETDAGASGDDKNEEANAAVNSWGTVKLEAPAKVMEGDIISVRANLPPELADKAAPSFSWDPDSTNGIRALAVLNAQDGRTDGPEADLQFLPRPELRKNQGNIGIQVYEKLKANQKGTPANTIARGYRSVEVLPMGCSVSASSDWQGGPVENGIVLKRKTGKGEPLSTEGEFILEITPWPNGTLEEAEKQVIQNSPYGKKESIEIDSYKGFMSVKGPFISDLRVTSGVYSAHVDLKGMVVKGQVALSFQGFLMFNGSPEKYDEKALKEYIDSGLAELRGIISSIRIVPDPKRTTGEAGAAPDKKEGELTVALKRISPASGPVAAGTPVEFKASIEGEKPEGKILFFFEPLTEIAFTPQETETGTTMAVFSEPGTVSVWAYAVGPEDKTLGESERIEIEVTGPEISFKVTPDKPMVGQEVAVKAAAKPALPEDAFIVWNLKGKSGRQGAKAADSTEFSFRAEEPAKYELEAEARSPKGETLAKNNTVIEVYGFDLSTSVIGTAGPRPKEWKEGEGLKDVPKDAFFTDEHVKVKVEIKDPAAPKDIRWKWIPSEGTSMASTSIGNEATLYRNEPGSASAEVEARDKDGLLLGKASVTFPVVALPAGLIAKPLKIALSADKETIEVNDQAVITADVEGGTAPYTWKWSNNVAAEEGKATLTPTEPGKNTISVTVTDKGKKTASATIVLNTTEFPVKLLDVPESVQLGTGFTPRVEFPDTPGGEKSGSKASLKIFWHASPKISMTRLSGPEKSNRLTPDRPGTIILRVEVKNSKGTIVGRSDKVSFNVSVPEFSLKEIGSIPAAGNALLEVILPSGLDPSLLQFDWKSQAPMSPRNSDGKRTADLGPVKGLGPVTYSVKISDRSSRTLLAELKEEITITPLEMNIDIGKCSEPSKIVHPGGKVDYVPAGTYTEKQTIELKATPLSRVDGASFAWEADPGTLFKGSKNGTSVTVSREKTGTAEVTVIAKHSNQEIGRASISLPVDTSIEKVQAADKFLTAINAWGSKQYNSAISSMKEALALDPGNEAIKSEVARMEGENTRQAESIWKKAAELQNAKQYEEALDKYREGLEIKDDPGVRDHVVKLEKFIAEMKDREDKRARAEAIWNEAASLQTAEKFEEALSKYREGLQVHEDEKVKAHADKLEKYIEELRARQAKEAKEAEEKARARAQAEKIWEEAAKLQEAEKFEEALGKYKEGLEISDDGNVRGHVTKLEQYLKDLRAKQAKEAAEKARARDKAEKIWEEAAKLQNAKKYEEALKRYREGLAIQEDPVIRDHVGKLEQYIKDLKKTQAAQSEQKQEETPQTQPKQETPAKEQTVQKQKPLEGKVSTSSTYAPNTKGDVFSGGSWNGSKNGSDWLQKDFGSLQEVSGIYIGRAGTDIKTEGSTITLKLQKENGEWIVVDQLKNTNINWSELSYGNVGKSIPSYSKTLNPPVSAKAFRLELKGNGWFIAGDIRITASPAPKSKATSQGGSVKDIDGWKKLSIGPISFQVPPDWQNKKISQSDGDALVAWKGSMNNPEMGISVVIGNYEEIAKAFKEERSKGTVGKIQVGGRTFEQVTSTVGGIQTMSINCGKLPNGKGFGIMVPTKSWSASKATIEKVLSTFRF